MIGSATLPAGTGSGALDGATGGNATTLQGRPIDSAAPNTNDVLTWNGSAWAPVAASSGLTQNEVKYLAIIYGG